MSPDLLPRSPGYDVAGDFARHDKEANDAVSMRARDDQVGIAERIIRKMSADYFSR
jgi:hypothetical protein